MATWVFDPARENIQQTFVYVERKMTSSWSSHQSFEEDNQQKAGIALEKFLLPKVWSEVDQKQKQVTTLQ